LARCADCIMLLTVSGPCRHSSRTLRHSRGAEHAVAAERVWQHTVCIIHYVQGWDTACAYQMASAAPHHCIAGPHSYARRHVTDGDGLLWPSSTWCLSCLCVVHFVVFWLSATGSGPCVCWPVCRHSNAGLRVQAGS
jgi:hypothetical protein